jgi:hypothetical protein
MLVRRTWVVIPITVAVCATFAARAVAALVDAQVPEPTSLPLASPPREKAPASRVKPDGSAFIVRNMFCSTCAPSPGGPPGPTDTFVPDAQLIATSVGDEPRATVRVRATEAQGSWGLGEQIPGVGKIEHIGFVTIDLIDTSGRRATLSLLEQHASAATEAPAAPAASDPYGDRLRKIDDRTYEVDRSLVRELVGGSMTKAGARVSPVTNKAGTLDGLKVLGVRKDGLAGKLGLESGDVLEAINNTKIESANTLLGLYAQLETLNTVELQGTRRGKPLTLTLRLR